MSSEAFPRATTLVRNWLNNGASSRAELLRYLMSIYERPLCIYLLGTSYRDLSEPEDIVHEFFIRYLARDGYLEKWRSTDKRLRRWLASGLLFYCRDYLNERRRHRGEPVDLADPPAPSDEAEREFEVQVKGQMVRAAMSRAEDDCAARGLAQHWRLFELYHLREVPLSRLAADHNLTPERTLVMVRTAQRAFEKAVRAIVAADLDTDDAEAIDDELSAQ